MYSVQYVSYNLYFLFGITHSQTDKIQKNIQQTIEHN